ncbi:unnamed protein product [Microthlaspi erraticum]|uniref:Uncharacterized protein n=1 Tax=Microthlaspi erraticum TaxID=1685480 RepID=A0A6D2KJR0_9BRAS|nr:unnamed protein product [Microthlaspi erraticum]
MANPLRFNTGFQRAFAFHVHTKPTAGYVPSATFSDTSIPNSTEHEEMLRLANEKITILEQDKSVANEKITKLESDNKYLKNITNRILNKFPKLLPSEDDDYELTM